MLCLRTRQSWITSYIYVIEENNFFMVVTPLHAFYDRSFVVVVSLHVTVTLYLLFLCTLRDVSTHPVEILLEGKRRAHKYTNACCIVCPKLVIRRALRGRLQSPSVPWRRDGGVPGAVWRRLGGGPHLAPGPWLADCRGDTLHRMETRRVWEP